MDSILSVYGEVIDQDAMESDWLDEEKTPTFAPGPRIEVVSVERHAVRGSQEWPLKDGVATPVESCEGCHEVRHSLLKR